MIEKDIPGYPSYKARCDGAIISYKRVGSRPLTPRINNVGYYRVALHEGGVVKDEYIDRLIADAFIPNPNGEMRIIHKDGNRLNNAVYNLMRGTDKEDLMRALACGRFKQIQEYPDYYASIDGDIYSYIDGLLTKLVPEVTNTGYYRVHIFANGVKKHESVHRLVAKTHIPNPDNLSEINHKDCNKGHNAVSNLEWIDSSGNKQHAIRAGVFVPFNNPPKKVIITDRYTGETETFISTRECAMRLGCTKQTIQLAIKHGYICKDRYKVVYEEPETLNNEQNKGITTLEV